MPRINEYLQLHFIILLNSFIPIIVKLIGIPAIEIVLFRTAIASVVVLALLRLRRIDFRVSPRTLAGLFASGVLTAIYWILLVVATKIANASVCLVGIATSSLWVTFFTPLFGKGGLNFYQFLTGLCAVFGCYIIFSSDFEYQMGLFVAIMAAIFGALVTIANGRLARHHHHYKVTFYQMLGAFLGSGAALPFFANSFGWEQTFVTPTSTDLALVVLLAFVFSIFLYSMVIRLMKSVSPFTVTLVGNLSPVYGILSALVVFGQSEAMNKFFYAGAVIIFFSVIAFPLTRYLASKIVIQENP
jgi:drug/metabolite transporter (DMT)-like permease